MRKQELQLNLINVPRGISEANRLFSACKPCVPERHEDAVSHKDAEAIHKRQLQTDVLEVVVGTSQ